MTGVHHIQPDFAALWSLDRALTEPERWWRAYHLRVARELLRGAREMLWRGDDVGTIVGVSLLVDAAEAHDIASGPLWSAVAEC